MQIFKKKSSYFYCIINILDKKEIHGSIYLFFLMFIYMLSEIFILNYILNILNYFSGNKFTLNLIEKIFAKHFLFFFNFETFLLISFAFFFFFLSLFFFFVKKNEIRFLTNLRANISNKLFKGYINMPLIFKMRSSTFDLVKNITNEVDFFIGTIYSFCIIAMEFLTLIGISIFLLTHSFKVSLIAILLFIIAVILFNIINKKKLSNISEQRSFHLEKRMQFIIEGLNSLKDIKLFGTFNETKKNFEFHNNRLSKISYISNYRNSISKPFFELYVVFLIFLFVIYANLNVNNVKNFIPTIGVFLFASYRLIPSLARFVSSLQLVQLNSTSAIKLYNDFKKVENYNSLVMQNKNDYVLNFKKNIEFKNVSFSYKEKSKLDCDLILKNLFLDIKKGERVGITGISGAGKSTFLDLFLGFYDPMIGEINIDNHNILKIKNHWQSIISCVPQEIFIKNDSFLNNISFGNKVEDEKFLKEIVVRVGLEKLLNSMESGLNTLIGDGGYKLSPGQKQRIAIARALYFKPQVIVLDESTSSLDTYNETNIIEEIIASKNNYTVLWVSHKKEIFKKFDKCYELKNGSFVK